MPPLTYYESFFQSLNNLSNAKKDKIIRLAKIIMNDKDDEMSIANIRRIISSKKNNIRLKCAYCKGKFELTQYDYANRLRAGERREGKHGVIHRFCCSHSCAALLARGKSSPIKRKKK